MLVFIEKLRCRTASRAALTAPTAAGVAVTLALRVTVTHCGKHTECAVITFRQPTGTCVIHFISTHMFYCNTICSVTLVSGDKALNAFKFGKRCASYRRSLAAR